MAMMAKTMRKTITIYSDVALEYSNMNIMSNIRNVCTSEFLSCCCCTLLCIQYVFVYHLHNQQGRLKDFLFFLFNFTTVTMIFHSVLKQVLSISLLYK